MILQQVGLPDGYLFSVALMQWWFFLTRRNELTPARHLRIECWPLGRIHGKVD